MTTLSSQTGLLTGRQLVLFGTLALHILVYQLLSATLHFHPVGDAADRIRTFFIEPPVQQPADLPPQLPVPVTDAGALLKALPLPVPTFDPPAEDSPAGDISGTREGEGAGGGTDVASPPGAPATEIAYTALRPTNDFYPPTAIRLGEEGAAILRVCVSASGAMLGSPAVTAGSGHPRLDAAAQAWASQALRFRPATRDGVPVEACKGFRVSFRPHD